MHCFFHALIFLTAASSFVASQDPVAWEVSYLSADTASFASASQLTIEYTLGDGITTEATRKLFARVLDRDCGSDADANDATLGLSIATSTFATVGQTGISVVVGAVLADLKDEVYTAPVTDADGSLEFCLEVTVCSISTTDAPTQDCSNGVTLNRVFNKFAVGLELSNAFTFGGLTTVGPVDVSTLTAEIGVSNANLGSLTTSWCTLGETAHDVTTATPTTAFSRATGLYTFCIEPTNANVMIDTISLSVRKDPQGTIVAPFDLITDNTVAVGAITEVPVILNGVVGVSTNIPFDFYEEAGAIVFEGTATLSLGRRGRALQEATTTTTGDFSLTFEVVPGADGDADSGVVTMQLVWAGAATALTMAAM